MPFVVDASVATSWLMLDERHPIADAALARLTQDTLVTLDRAMAVAAQGENIALAGGVAS